MKKKEISQGKPTGKKKASRGTSKKPVPVKNMSPMEINRLVENLQTHQVELEAQNEELRVMQAELETTRDKYQDLYDFSPVAYLTLGKGDIISDINLTGSTLLGIGRSSITGLPFRKLVHKEDQDIYYLNRQKLLETGDRRAYELRIIKKDRTEFYARVESMVVRSSKDETSQIRMAVMDVTSRVLTELELKLNLENLRAANNELMRFNRAAVDRELRMIELKKEVNDLRGKLGQAQRYRLDSEGKNHEFR